MLDTTLLDKIFKKSGLANKKFEPEYVDLRADNQFDTNVKEVYSEDKNFVNVEKAQIKPKSIGLVYPVHCLILNNSSQAELYFLHFL